MKSAIFFICTLILLLSACSGNSLAPKNNNISVDSQPSMSSVYIMGEMVGTTPITIDSNRVFPAVYLPQDEHDYGHVTLKHAGCADKKIRVSPRMISDGLMVSLDCSVKEEVMVEGAAEKSVKRRLIQLQSLKDEGLISDQEYQEIRSRILKSL